MKCDSVRAVAYCRMATFFGTVHVALAAGEQGTCPLFWSDTTETNDIHHGMNCNMCNLALCSVIILGP